MSNPIMMLEDSIATAQGLTVEDAQTVHDLVREWRVRLPRNQLRDRYFLGHVPLKDIGVAIPPQIRSKIDPRVGWAKKAVTALADRVQFEGYTSDDETTTNDLHDIAVRNDLGNLLRKATICELKHCCSFLTVTDSDDGPVISAYPATAAAALWDDERKAIQCGLVVVASEKMPESDERWPYKVDVFTHDYVIRIERDPRRGDRPSSVAWHATYHGHSMGRVLMEPLAFSPTLERPFGTSRITRTVMSLVDEMQRAKAYATLAAAFAASPQKYLLGTDDDPIKDNRWNAYIGSILTFTMNGEGEAPEFGQLPQPSMQPHADYMRQLAAQFAGETGVPVSSLGIMHDQMSSSEAMAASREDLVIEATNMINDNKRALRNIATMALAVKRRQTFAQVRDSGVTIDAIYANPSRPSTVTQSDAMVKQIAAIPWLAETDVALEQLGYPQEDIRRMKADRRISQGMSLLSLAAQNRQQTSAAHSQGINMANLASESVPSGEQ